MTFAGCAAFEWCYTGLPLERARHSLFCVDVESNRRRVCDVTKEGDSWFASLVSLDGSTLLERWFSTLYSAKLEVERVARLFGAEIPESFAGYVLRRRTEERMSQAGLAKRAGLDHTTVRSVEQGLFFPRPVTMAKLIAVLGPPGSSPAAPIASGSPTGSSGSSASPTTWTPNIASSSLEERVQELERIVARLRSALLG